MSTTVYAELCRELNLFIKEYGLLIEYEWGFKLYNRSRSWGYRRLFSACDHELLMVDKRRYAEMVVEDIRKHLKEKGVI